MTYLTNVDRIWRSNKNGSIIIGISHEYSNWYCNALEDEE